jgi:hypothetical protein
MSIFETQSQKEMAAQRQEMMHSMVMQQQLMQHRDMMEQQKMAAVYNSGGVGVQAPSYPSKINEALDFKDWVRDTLPDVWDQYRAVKDIERCSK